jgi:inner membrane protein
MDPLTHTLTGLALSRAGLNRRSAYATPILLLAANAPDIDIAALAGGSVSYLHYHRYITHAFFAVPFLAWLPVLVVRLWAKKPFDWKWAYLVSVLGVLTHPLLDWMNPYGVRFLLPFSSRWYRLDILSLGDVWIWAVLLSALLAPALARLVSSEIGARPGSGRGWAVAALSFLLLYSCGRDLLHERALATLDSRLYDGMEPVRVAAFPRAASPFRWAGLVETAQFYSILDVNLLGEFDPTAGRVLYKPEPGPREAAAAAAARKTEAFRVFLNFSQYPYWRFTPADHPEDAIGVDVMDLRFGAPPHQRFVATAIVDRTGRVVRSGFAYQPRER